MAATSTARKTPAEIPAEAASAHHSHYEPALLLESIHPHPKNIRHDATADQELIDSIAEQGLLEPLLVAPHPDTDLGGYILIAGHRRRDGLTKAGYTHAPAIIREDLLDEADQVAAMLVENGRRADLTPLEEAEGYGQLRFEFGWKPGAIAKKAGHSVETINKRLRLLKLDDKVKDKLHDGGLTLDDAVTIAEFPAEEQKKLTRAAGTVNFRYELEQAKSRRKQKERFDKEVAQLKSDGVPEKKLPASTGSVWGLRDAEHGMVPLGQTFSRDKGDHPDCLAWIASSGWSGPEVEYVCTNVSGHDDQLDDQRRAAREAEEAARREEDERERAEQIARNLRVDAVIGSLKPGTKVDPALAGLIRVLTLHLLDTLGEGWSYEAAEIYFEIAQVPEDARWGVGRLWTVEDREHFRKHAAATVDGPTPKLLRTFAALAAATIEAESVSEVSTHADTKTIKPRESMVTAAAWITLAELAGHTPTDIDRQILQAAAGVDEVPS